MVNEREILKVLWYVRSYGSNISEVYFELEFVEFAKLLLFIKETGLIKGVEALYADNPLNTISGNERDNCYTKNRYK